MRIQSAYQGSGCAFGSQVRVHVEEAGGADAHHLAGHAGDCGGHRLGDEHDVHIRDVVQLPRAALAHGDDSQVRVDILIAVDISHRDRQRSRQRRVRQVREPVRGVGVRHRFALAEALHGGESASEVRGCNAHHEVAMRGAELLLCDANLTYLSPIQARPVRIHANRAEHGAEHVGAGREVVAKQSPLLRVGNEVIRQRGRATEQREEARAEDRVRAQFGKQLVPRIQRPVQAGGVVERPVRIRGTCQRVAALLSIKTELG